jgi:hypothetical protein
VSKRRELGIVGASPGNRVNALRPYLGHGSISYRESSGSSVYHSMQVSFNRRLSRLARGALAQPVLRSALDGWHFPGSRGCGRASPWR